MADERFETAFADRPQTSPLERSRIFDRHRMQSARYDEASEEFVDCDPFCGECGETWVHPWGCTTRRVIAGYGGTERERERLAKETERLLASLSEVASWGCLSMPPRRPVIEIVMSVDEQILVRYGVGALKASIAKIVKQFEARVQGKRRPEPSFASPEERGNG